MRGFWDRMRQHLYFIFSWIADQRSGKSVALVKYIIMYCNFSVFPYLATVQVAIFTSRVCSRGIIFVVCVCVCLSVCLCLFVCLGYNFWTSWHRLHFWCGGTSWQYLGQVWVSRSLGQGQGHLMENANLATWTSV